MQRNGGRHPDNRDTLPRVGCPKQPVQHCLDLEWLEVGLQGEYPRGDAREVWRGPAGGRFAREWPQIATTVGLELDLLAEFVGEVQRIIEEPLIDRNQGWREG